MRSMKRTCHGCSRVKSTKSAISSSLTPPSSTQLSLIFAKPARSAASMPSMTSCSVPRRVMARKRSSFSVSRLMLRCVTPASRSSRATSLSRLPFVVTQSTSTPGISDNMRQKSTAPRRTSGSPPVTRIFLTPQRTAAAAISRSSSSEQKSPCARFSTPSSGMQ